MRYLKQRGANHGHGNAMVDGAGVDVTPKAMIFVHSLATSPLSRGHVAWLQWFSFGVSWAWCPFRLCHFLAMWDLGHVAQSLLCFHLTPLISER